MKEILSSTTRLVFVIMALAVITFTWMNIIPAESFMGLATLVFSNYFFKKQSLPPKDESEKDTKK